MEAIASMHAKRTNGKNIKHGKIQIAQI